MHLVNPHGRKVNVPNAWQSIFHKTLCLQGWTLYEDTYFINENADKDTILIERPFGGLGDLVMISEAVRTKAKEKGKVTITTLGQYSWLFRYDDNIDFLDYNIFVLNYKENRSKFYSYYDLNCPCIRHKEQNQFRPFKGRVQLFAEALGVTPKKPTIKYNKQFREERFDTSEYKVALILKTMDKNRSYPLDRWYELAKMLKDAGYRPITFDTKTAFEGIDKVVGTSQERLTAIIDQMDLIVTADTGVLHIAGALNKPMITLFGSTNGKLVTAFYDNVHIIQKLKGNTPCFRPCYINTQYNNYCCSPSEYSSCMLEIPVKEVFDAVNDKYEKQSN